MKFNKLTVVDHRLFNGRYSSEPDRFSLKLDGHEIHGIRSYKIEGGHKSLTTLTLEMMVDATDIDAQIATPIKQENGQ